VEKTMLCCYAVSLARPGLEAQAIRRWKDKASWHKTRRCIA
jgi:hypothetical protein